MFTRSKCNMDEIFGLKFNFPSFFFDIPPFTKKVIFVPEFVILCKNPPFYEVNLLLTKKGFAHRGFFFSTPCSHHF